MKYLHTAILVFFMSSCSDDHLEQAMKAKNSDCLLTVYASELPKSMNKYHDENNYMGISVPSAKKDNPCVINDIDNPSEGLGELDSSLTDPISRFLNDGDTSNDSFYELAQDVGGMDKLWDLVETLDDDALRELFATRGIEFVPAGAQ